MRATCARYEVAFIDTPEDVIVAVADNVASCAFPLNGLRHRRGDTSGWFVWAGEECVRIQTSSSLFMRATLTFDVRRSWPCLGCPRVLAFSSLPASKMCGSMAACWPFPCSAVSDAGKSRWSAGRGETRGAAGMNVPLSARATSLVMSGETHGVSRRLLISVTASGWAWASIRNDESASSLTSGEGSLVARTRMGRLRS